MSLPIKLDRSVFGDFVFGRFSLDFKVEDTGQEASGSIKLGLYSRLEIPGSLMRKYVF